MKIPVNKTGYLKGAKTAKNPVNIIPSSLITTQGMAFPIKANGKTLYPNTGQYKFSTPNVVETPLKQKGALSISANNKKQFMEIAKQKPKPIKKEKTQLEDNDSWLENAAEIVDPTGFTSYDDVYRSYKNTGLSGETALEALGAIPLLGKIGKSGKIISGGFNLLQKIAPKVKYLPKGMQKGAMDKVVKAYQSYANNGGKDLDNFLGTVTKKFMDKVPYVNPSSQKYKPAARFTFNNAQRGAKIKDAVSTALGSKNNEGLKYNPNEKDNTLTFNGRNILPTFSSEYMYQKGTKNTKVEKENPVASWVKDRIIDRVQPTTYDILPRVGEFIFGDKYNAKKKINPERGNEEFKTGLAADQDVLALSFGRKARNNAVVKQNTSKPISDKSKNSQYYSIPSINKDYLVRNYLKGKERMTNLNKKYPGKVEYNLFEKALDYLPNSYSRLSSSYSDKKDLADYRKKGVVYQSDEGMYNNDESFGPMGNFGTWEGKDKKGRYISYKDKIDYQGSILGKAIKPMLNQKDVNIYDRIYIDAKGNPITPEAPRVKPRTTSKTIKYKDGSKGVSLAFSRGEKDPKGGLTQKGVDKYNRATGGNLKMAVTTPPSKLKPGSKAANRRKSFCARMSGVKGPMRKPNGKPTRKALALRKWNC